MLNNDKLIKITCVAVLSEIAYQLYQRLKRKVKKNTLSYSLIECFGISNPTGVLNKVLFFPVKGISCRRTTSGRICRDKNCHAVHEETSLSFLLNVLQFTQKKLDVCVYMITCSILGDALVQCFERGVSIRIITEEKNSGEEGEMIGAQIGKLRTAGIPVHCSSISFWMHHKFMVADDEVLVNGSFNWTNQAVMGNMENLIITNEKDLVHPFVSEFQRLWDTFSNIEDL